MNNLNNVKSYQLTVMHTGTTRLCNIIFKYKMFACNKSCDRVIM